MKKIIASCLVLLTAMTYSNAQKITYDPPVPDPDLPMTIVIDLEATETTTLADYAVTPDIYVWTWIEGLGDSPTNGTGWSSSDERNKMTKVGTTGKKYTFTYGPTLKAHFQKDAQDLWGKKLGCLAKAKDGAGNPENKTENMLITIPTPPSGPQLVATHPLKVLDTVQVDRNDIVTFIYNNALDTLVAMHNPPLGPDDVAVFTRVYFYGDAAPYNFSPPSTYDSNPALSMKAVAGSTTGEYRLSFIPNQFFTVDNGCNPVIISKLAAGIPITKITMRVVKKRAAAGTVNPINGPATYPFGLPR